MIWVFSIAVFGAVESSEMKKKYLTQRLGFALIISMLIIASADTVTDAQVNNEWDVYLPLIMKNYPITPLTPVLNPISNQDGNGSYSVSWSSSEGASTYLLQEDDNANFSSPLDTYEGSSTSKEISGRDIGTYHYRVMATNSYASSGWSNVESVVVTVALPDCPQAGIWQGTTSQDMSISFVVENSPECQIEPGSLVVGWSTGWSAGCSGDAWTRIIIPIDIVEDKFDYSDSSFNAELDELHGTFNSSDMADGTFQVEYTVYSPYTKTCSSGVVVWQTQPFYGLDGSVEAIHIQPDDSKILIGGTFRFVKGVERNYLARLNSDGSLDASFNAFVGDDVYSIAQQADGKILVGGHFENVAGVEHKSIARLNSNGSLDNSFNTNIDFSFVESLFPIDSIVVLPDGDILVEGLFNIVDGQERNYVARLNPDGSLNDSFNANVQWAGGQEAKIAVHEDQIYIAGVFEVGEEYFPPKLARVNQYGSLDGNFTPYIYTGTVGPIAIQTDGKIIVSDGENILRLNDDGTTDTSFNAPITNDRPLTMAINTEGKIVVGGRFDSLDGQLYPYICQLNSGGTLNPAFKPEPNATVVALAIQPDGKILVGGGFSEIGGAVRYKVARLNTDGSVDLTFNPGP